MKKSTQKISNYIKLIGGSLSIMAVIIGIPIFFATSQELQETKNLIITTTDIRINQVEEDQEKFETYVNKQFEKQEKKNEKLRQEIKKDIERVDQKVQKLIDHLIKER